MPIAFYEPFDPATHQHLLKQARGLACYGAIAAHFGTESPRHLEWRIDQRQPYDSDGDPSGSNKFLRWRQGKALPSDDTVTQVLERSGGSVNLRFWRDLSLWTLLSAQPPPLPILHHHLENAGLQVRKILFFDGLPSRNGRFNHSTPDRQQILGIRNLNSLEAFMILICLSRKGEQLEDDPQQFLPAACAYDMLPRMLYSYQALRYRWETLFGCMHRLLWNRVYSTDAVYTYEMDAVRNNLDQLLRHPDTVLGRRSGNRLKMFAGDPIQQLIDRDKLVKSVT